MLSVSSVVKKFGMIVELVQFHMRRFRFAEAESVAAEFEFERVTERGGTEAADFDAGRDAHFEQAAADFVGAGDARDAAHFADRELGRGACHADILAATSTEHISPSRKQSFVPPTRTMQGEPPCTSSSCAPARMPSSSSRRDLFGLADDLPHLGPLAGEEGGNGQEIVHWDAVCLLRINLKISGRL